MARVTVEDCVDKIPNRFDLVLLASQPGVRVQDHLLSAPPESVTILGVAEAESYTWSEAEPTTA